MVPAPSTPIVAAALPADAPVGLESSSWRGGCSGISWDSRPRRSSGGDERVDPGHRAPDDQLLDLRGPLVEGRHARIAEVALDGMVVDVARAAVDLDGEVRALQRGLGRVQLGD